MGVKREFKYKEAQQILTDAMNAGLTRAAIAGQRQAVLVMGSEGGSVIGHTGTGRNLYAPSPAGRFPGIRTGGLRRSIYATPGRNLRAAFGTNLRYGRWLEEGTKRMDARPWLDRSAQLARPAMRREFAQTTRAYIASRGGGS